MNRGDAGYLILNIRVNKEPITKDYADEIEVTFNKANTKQNQIRKTLKHKDILWDEDIGKFKLFLTQEDTFKLNVGENTWHIRLLLEEAVLSSLIGKIYLGDVNSGEVLK